jgi:hypothetical protein
MSINHRNFAGEFRTLLDLQKYFNSENSRIIHDQSATDFVINGNMESALDQILNEYKYWAGSSFANKSETKEYRASLQSVPESDFWPTIKEKLLPTKILVDLGVGVRPNFFLGQEFTVCVELYRPYLDHLRKNLIGENLVLVEEDALSFLKKQPSRSIETIISTDLIEHLSREDGLELISEIERTVKKQAIVVTPRGFMPQEINENDDDGWGFVGNLLQNHISAWEPEDFPKWELIICEEYCVHLDHPHPNGVIGCLFFPSTSETSNTHLVIEPFADQARMVELTTQLFETLDEYSFENKGEQISYTLPLFYSGRSITVDPNMVLPNGDIHYSSFNPEVNKVYFEPKETDKKVFFPGTVLSNLQNQPKSKIIVFTEETMTFVDYKNLLDNETKYFKLDESLIIFLRTKLAKGYIGSIQTLLEEYTH